MSERDNSWKTNIWFVYRYIKRYFEEKTNAKNVKWLEGHTSSIPNVLPSERFNDIDALITYLQGKLSYESPEDKAWSNYLAANTAENLKKDLWIFREFIFCCTMLFVANLLEPAPSSIKIGTNPERIKPSTFSLKNHQFTVIGSTGLTSDVDITIQGPDSSFVISVIEDIYSYMTEKGIPIKYWDVEFYGDFKLLKFAFINFTKLQNNKRILLLKYAIISYLRSMHQYAGEPKIHENAKFLIKKFLERTGGQFAFDDIVTESSDYWYTTAPNGQLNREDFYYHLRKVESDSKIIQWKEDHSRLSDNAKMQTDGIDIEDLAFSLIREIAEGNIHRPESYILPSTAVHVVEFEQQNPTKSEEGLPNSWFSDNARIGIDPDGYLLSAIEQLGYLEHYHPEGVPCDKKGIKYFGRYVRALISATLLKEDSMLGEKGIIEIVNELDEFRKSTDQSQCKYNIHELLKGIHNLLAFPLYSKVNLNPVKGPAIIPNPNYTTAAAAGGRRSTRRKRRAARNNAKRMTEKGTR